MVARSQAVQIAGGAALAALPGPLVNPVSLVQTLDGLWSSREPIVRPETYVRATQGAEAASRFFLRQDRRAGELGELEGDAWRRAAPDIARRAAKTSRPKRGGDDQGARTNTARATRDLASRDLADRGLLPAPYFNGSNFAGVVPEPPPDPLSVALADIDRTWSDALSLALSARLPRRAVAVDPARAGDGGDLVAHLADLTPWGTADAVRFDQAIDTPPDAFAELSGANQAEQRAALAGLLALAVVAVVLVVT